MSDDLVATLHQAGHDYTDKAADLIKAQAARIKSLDARIAELKTELKIWWDENVKNKIACQQKEDRIAELEAALQKKGCARDQKTTQYCAEVISRDARIVELEAALRQIEYLDRPQVRGLLRGLPRRKPIQEIARAALEGGKE